MIPMAQRVHSVGLMNVHGTSPRQGRPPKGSVGAKVTEVKTAQPKVVRGAIVTRSKFPEGTRLTLVEHDERTPITVDAEDEAAILEGIGEIEAGKGVPLPAARARLRRRSPRR